MLSRVADAIYWTNRQIERAENVARFVDVNLTLGLDLPPGVDGQWAPLVATAGDDAEFAARYGEATRENVVEFLAFDRRNPNSILSCLRGARENARTIREIISSEMWLQINQSYLAVEEAVRTGRGAEDLPGFFARVKLDSHLFAGIMDATMSHNEAWHFGRLGRLLERADKTSRILDVKYFYLLPEPSDVGSPLDDLQWSAVLRSASALEMYRKERRRRISPLDVADFLLLDREFPRSIRWCVVNAEASLRAVTGSPPRTFRNEAEKRLGRLAADFHYVDVNDVLRDGLHEFLQDVQVRLNRVGEAIQETFFSPDAVRPLGAAATQ